MLDVTLHDEAKRCLSALAADPTDPVSVAAALDEALALLAREGGYVVGATGFGAFAGRALHTTAQRAPWLAGVRFESSGNRSRLVGVAEGARGLEASVVLDGAMALVANLLELFCDFIGTPLTTRLVRRAWAGPLEPLRGDVDPKDMGS